MLTVRRIHLCHRCRWTYVFGILGMSSAILRNTEHRFDHSRMTPDLSATRKLRFNTVHMTQYSRGAAALAATPENQWTRFGADDKAHVC